MVLKGRHIQYNRPVVNWSDITNGFEPGTVKELPDRRKWIHHHIIINNVTIEVQCKSSDTLYQCQMWGAKENQIYKLERDYQLEIIGGLLHTIDLTEYQHFLYLLRDPNGQYSLIEKQKQPRPDELRSPVWMSVIDESELEIINHYSDGYCSAIWNGQTVDAFIDFFGFTLARRTDEVIGHKMVSGLDVAYELLAHISRDGKIVGYVTEPQKGRQVEYRDRAKVYAALAKLKAHRILCFVEIDTIMIDDGKVRLNLEGSASFDDHVGLRYWQDPEEFYDNIFWPEVDRVFGILAQGPSSWRPFPLFPTTPITITIIGHPQLIRLDCLSEYIVTLYDHFLRHRKEYLRIRKRSREKGKFVESVHEKNYAIIEAYLNSDEKLPPFKPKRQQLQISASASPSCWVSGHVVNDDIMRRVPSAGVGGWHS